MEVRGHAVLIDSHLVPLTSASMIRLRELSSKPGHVVSRTRLLAITPGEAGGGHAIEVAIGRLRAALGDPRIIQTVLKRGYRLAYEPEQASNCGY
jgi:uroporphyrinogen-III synthase